MQTEKESMRSTLDSILAKVNMVGMMNMNMNMVGTVNMNMVGMVDMNMMYMMMGRRGVTRWT